VLEFGRLCQELESAQHAPDHPVQIGRLILSQEGGVSPNRRNCSLSF
jgi:hypothetical protein